MASIAAAVFFFLFVFTPRPWLASDRPSRIQYFGCGNSTADASAAGCRFDWSWYSDEEGTQQLSLNDVAMGQHDYVYVTWKYYNTHCTYMWKKMHRSLLTSREIDSYISDYRHTEQCERVLLDRERAMESTSVMLVAKYPSCPVVSK
ncbi:hypothetical protein M406DRAFT_355445 [Cryphonectria parasitica EP155]|uniref:Uncharacterized protein n=1 Tax=Cryphonectria parasitica (strain ATCC 38755 / EP155) TaxID=660469 RepID=A0A9P4Y5T4_CRYP1|nr:uncharacterized protein M406DRAFT_355445 [Cryphonectria parasitica EP155]KAF3767035.1 hypothetical protein M406DRAFT_355445 [Cryphonectria parasitica EP155]